VSDRYLCVYCGSSAGSEVAYAEGARALARALVANGYGLVYGGASVGLMGILADAVLAAGGRVIGVIPQALQRKELAHRRLDELRIVASMHERKATMADLAAGFVALPGGIGTLEELFEVWTWSQLGIHAKPCGLLNVAGYYDRLVAFLDHTVATGFVRPAHRQMLLVESDPEALLRRFAQHRAPAVEKWLDRAAT
jgi:uncharacterized protein (TIGR00730 family)